MEDIIDIYEPVYRSTFHWGILLIIVSAIILGVFIFLILKKIRNKNLTPSIDEVYNNTLEEIIILQKKLPNISSKIFSYEVTNLLKKYLSFSFNSDFKHLTNEEIISRLMTENFLDQNLNTYLLKNLQEAHFGKLDLTEEIKTSILESVANTVNIVYKNLSEVPND